MEMSVFLSDGGKVARPSTTQGSNSTRGTTRCISVQEVAARTDLVHELYKGKRGLCLLHLAKRDRETLGTAQIASAHCPVLHSGHTLFNIL